MTFATLETAKANLSVRARLSASTEKEESGVLIFLLITSLFTSSKQNHSGLLQLYLCTCAVNLTRYTRYIFCASFNVKKLPSSDKIHVNPR